MKLSTLRLVCKLVIAISAITWTSIDLWDRLVVYTLPPGQAAGPLLQMETTPVFTTKTSLKSHCQNVRSSCGTVKGRIVVIYLKPCLLVAGRNQSEVQKIEHLGLSGRHFEFAGQHAARAVRNLG